MGSTPVPKTRCIAVKDGKECGHPVKVITIRGTRCGAFFLARSSEEDKFVLMDVCPQCGTTYSEETVASLSEEKGALAS